MAQNQTSRRPRRLPAVAELVFGQAGTRLTSLRVPAQEFSELSVVAKLGHVANGGEQDGLPHQAHATEAFEDGALLGRPGIKLRVGVRWTEVSIGLAVAASVVAAAWMAWVVSQGTNQPIQPG